jgi:hypothetical protein
LFANDWVVSEIHLVPLIELSVAMSRRRSRRRSRQTLPTEGSSSRRSRYGAGSYPLDRWAMGIIAGLSVCLGVLIFSGDHATARVRDFSWQDRQVGAEDRAFLLTFSRPMDPASVEANLTITPPLPGKISWAGRRMAYTLTEPIPYGGTYAVTLDEAEDRFATVDSEGSRFQPFQGQFQTRKTAFLYIGVEGEEEGRLVLADLGQQERTILTPKNLVVIDFEPYPLGDRVLFSASDKSSTEGLLNQQIYTVTTGIEPQPPADFTSQSIPLWRRLWPQAPTPPSGELELLLDNSAYQNLKFDLSPDGTAIVVQRVNQQNPADFGPWLLRDNAAPQPLDTEPGGDFIIAPDNQSLVLLQGQGTAIIDIGEKSPKGATSEPLDFLPDYGRVFDFTDDGTAAAMVNFNQNDPERRFTESLFIVTNQGREEELLQVTGAILDAQFDPLGRFLYVLASEMVTDPDRDGEYIEQPVLLAVNIETSDLIKLLLLPTQQQRVHISLAPDGLSMLLDLEADAITEDTVREGFNPDSNQPIWRLPLFADAEQRATGSPTILEPESFPFKGLMATWLP